MARNIKNGLEYFPCEVGMFSDIKVRKLIKYHSGKSVTVYTSLLCCIYRDGYFMRWDLESPFIIAEITGFDETFIKEVVRCCLTVELFDQKLFDEYSVLSSRGIQKRYSEICKILKRKAKVSEFKLISPEEMKVTSEESDLNGESIPQTKGKERKLKEGKEKDEIALTGQKLLDAMKTLENSPQLEQIAMHNQLSKDAVLCLLTKFKPRFKLEYPSYQEFVDHFKNMVNKEKSQPTESTKTSVVFGKKKV